MFEPGCTALTSRKYLGGQVNAAGTALFAIGTYIKAAHSQHCNWFHASQASLWSRLVEVYTIT